MPDRALLCGINNYKSVSDLRGCLNDLADMQALLVDVFGFRPSSVRALRDSEVTKANVRKNWRWLLKDAKPGDRLVLHFSGHGSYVADRDGDEDDGADELICLYDMDFDDPDSYLLDDEIRELTSQIPEGVNFTFVFDSCHSGTATRMAVRPGSRAASFDPAKRPMVAVGDSVARLATGRAAAGARALGAIASAPDAAERVTAPATQADERAAVLARFIEPPPSVLTALSRGGVKRTLRAAAAARELNHVLFAGSQSDQTSADAFIDGDYHGAFTHYLCQAARQAGNKAECAPLIRAVREGLATAQFSQIPQLEPDTTSGPFLGARDPGGSPQQDASQSEEGEAIGVGDVAELLRESVRLQRELLEVLRGRRPDLRARAPRRHLVNVHGICWHEAGFSDPWWAALEPHLPASLRMELGENRHEVVWADLVSRPPGSRAAFSAARSAEERDLAEEIRDILQDRAERQALEALPEQAAARPVERGLAFDPLAAGARGEVAERALFGIPGLDCVDDFVKYLTDDGVRRAVLERFSRVVEPLLAAGDSVHVVSHSWGTVVAYEGLRAFDGRGFGGRVETFFTVGSALSIAPVKRRLRPGDGSRPRTVGRWVNLDAKGDPVGGPLKGRPFAVDEEFLNLAPVGCRPFLGMYSPGCAHGSYFVPDNVAVNRDLFARFLGG